MHSSVLSNLVKTFLLIIFVFLVKNTSTLIIISWLYMRKLILKSCPKSNVVYLGTVCCYYDTTINKLNTPVVGKWTWPQFVIFWFSGAIWDPITWRFFFSCWNWKGWGAECVLVRARWPCLGRWSCRSFGSCFPCSGTYSLLICVCFYSNI